MASTTATHTEQQLLRAVPQQQANLWQHGPRALTVLHSQSLLSGLLLTMVSTTGGGAPKGASGSLADSTWLNHCRPTPWTPANQTSTGPAGSSKDGSSKGVRHSAACPKKHMCHILLPAGACLASRDQQTVLLLLLQHSTLNIVRAVACGV